MVQVEVKGRVNLDKLTAFLEELRVSRSRTVSLGTLMCARDASAADNTHIVEVRSCYRFGWPVRLKADGICAFPAVYVLLLAGNHSLSGVERCIGRATHQTAYCTPSDEVTAWCLRCALEHGIVCSEGAGIVLCLVSGVPSAVAAKICFQAGICVLPMCCCTAKSCSYDKGNQPVGNQLESQREAQQVWMNAQGEKLVPHVHTYNADSKDKPMRFPTSQKGT